MLEISTAITLNSMSINAFMNMLWMQLNYKDNVRNIYMWFENILNSEQQ